MAGKQIVYGEEARASARGRQQARQRRQGHPRPQGPQRHPRQEVRRADRHQGRRDRRQGDRARGPFENMGAQMVKEVARRPATSPATAPPPRPSWPRPSSARASKNVTAGANPMDLKRGIDQAVEAVVDDHQQAGQAGRRTTRDRPGRHHLRQQRHRDRRDDRRRHGQGRQGRRHHRRRSQGHGDHARRGRGHAVRPRLPLALLRDRRRAHGSACSRTPTS